MNEKKNAQFSTQFFDANTRMSHTVQTKNALFDTI